MVSNFILFYIIFWTRETRSYVGEKFSYISLKFGPVLIKSPPLFNFLILVRKGSIKRKNAYIIFWRKRKLPVKFSHSRIKILEWVWHVDFFFIRVLKGEKLMKPGKDGNKLYGMIHTWRMTIFIVSISSIYILYFILIRIFGTMYIHLLWNMKITIL